MKKCNFTIYFLIFSFIFGQKALIFAEIDEVTSDRYPISAQSSYVASNKNEKLYNLKTIAKKIINPVKAAATIYFGALSYTLFHELGHALALKSLTDSPIDITIGECHWDPNPPIKIGPVGFASLSPIAGCTHYAGLIPLSNNSCIFRKVSGPVLGALSHYIFLAIKNSIEEKDKNLPVLTKIKNSLIAPFLLLDKLAQQDIPKDEFLYNLIVIITCYMAHINRILFGMFPTKGHGFNVNIFNEFNQPIDNGDGSKVWKCLNVRDSIQNKFYLVGAGIDILMRILIIKKAYNCFNQYLKNQKSSHSCNEKLIN